MIGTKLHKWLFSLTLIISLVSFSGIVHEQVKPVNAITEVVISNSPSSSVNYTSFVKQNFVQESTTFCSFNFKTFIQTQNGIFSQKEKAQNSVVLVLKNAADTLHLKLASVSNTDDYPFTFIG